uniref:Integrase zinc-binding domain-containing protein n=1 Tax=Tanacetum cinerariifolium TaxID=118510 RepID=A0A6L2LSI1_TANCI|nr:hypothetical protein [Tanacetum cinerariifolium]
MAQGRYHKESVISYMGCQSNASQEVKGQVLADFLADTPAEISATPELASTPRIKDIPESSNARENVTPGPRAWRLNTDEASNNGGSGADLILIALDDVEYSYALRLNFYNSNNEAKYEALLAGLRIDIEMQVKDIHVFVDSMLVAKNKKANALSKLAAVKFDYLSKEVLVKVLKERSVKAQEKLYNGRWSPILEILHGPIDEVVAKAINLGYFWPSMYRDAMELIKRCDDCQTHASVPRLPKVDMISVTSTWLFMKWGMDIVGPILEGLRRVKYLIVVTDYFTKSIEAKPLATITGKAVERANRSLLRGIKTRLEKGGSSWAEEVPNVLWAHRTKKKTSNGETPFSLTYGTEAVIPVDIGMPTHQTSSLNEKLMIKSFV